MDGDGKINASEFINAAIDHQKLLNADALAKLFNLFDEDRNGYIELEEVLKVCQANGNTHLQKGIRLLFSEVDENQDQKISWDEFNNHVDRFLNDITPQ